MKTRNKIMMLLLLATVVFARFTGCAKTGQCEDCGQTEKLNRFVDKSGETHWYRDYCYNLEKLAAGL